MNDFFEHIGDYLNHKLSAPDRSRFEEAMKEDPDLTHAVENYHIAEEAIEVLLEDDIRNVINSFEENNSGEVQSKLGIKTFLIVAGIMAALAIGAYLIKKNTQPDIEMLYAQYYSEYIETGLRGPDRESNELSLCDRGHAFMQDEKFSEAQNVLIMSSESESSCTDKSQWYLSLLYLKLKKPSQRDSLLSIIELDRTSPYQQHAIRLYKDLH